MDKQTLTVDKVWHKLKMTKDPRMKTPMFNRESGRQMMVGPMRLSWKRGSALNMRQSLPSLAMSRVTYARFVTCLMSLYEIDLVYMDECSINATMVRKYGWTKKNTKMKLLHTDRETSLAVIVAVSRRGLVHILV